MSEPSSFGYFEAYPTAAGTVIEIYLSPQDFHRARRGRITIQATAADEGHQGVAHIYVTRTTEPAHRVRKTSSPDTSSESTVDPPETPVS